MPRELRFQGSTAVAKNLKLVISRNKKPGKIPGFLFKISGSTKELDCLLSGRTIFILDGSFRSFNSL